MRLAFLFVLLGMAMGQDVPAIKATRPAPQLCNLSGGSTACKSNVLLTAEDGEKWCHAVHVGNPKQTKDYYFQSGVPALLAPGESAVEGLSLSSKHCAESITFGHTTKRISDLFPEECAPPKPAK